jgi:uncharacterized sodium:solute symporter family permease YidK
VDGNGVAVIDKAERSWGDAERSGVDTALTGELLSQTVFKLTGTNQTLVSGPQAGHCLANGTKGVLHCASLEGVTIFGKSVVTTSVCKDLKVRNWVFDSCQ